MRVLDGKALPASSAPIWLPPIALSPCARCRAAVLGYSPLLGATSAPVFNTVPIVVQRKKKKKSATVEIAKPEDLPESTLKVLQC